MDTFFTLLKKSLVATVFIVFALVATYIPQPYNNVSEVEAGGAGGGSTLPLQITQNLNLIKTNIQATLSAGYDAVTSFASNSLFIKETILDGIAWVLAKAIVSGMVSSLVNWINSGFAGSPAFVQDLQGFLLQTADQAFGEYLQSLGGFGSFVCSPFRLDVQISLALQYDQSRKDQPAPTCTLSGIIDNIEGFIGGSFEEGGWKDWFKLTSSPETYTPYGSALAAQAGSRVQILNAEGEAFTLLDFGDGFLSGEICEIVEGPGGSKEDCFISKPGQVISEALSFNLDSGRQTLIAADEFNEIIAALLGQLANKAITGTAGLLGLSGGTGYTDNSYSGGSFTNQLQEDAAGDFDFNRTKTLIDEALVTQTAYYDLARIYESQLDTYSINPLNDAGRKAAAKRGRDDARAVIIDTQGAFPEPFVAAPNSLIGRLNEIITEWEDPTTTGDTRLRLAGEYTTLDLYTESAIKASSINWETLLDND